MKPLSIATYKIIKQGERGVYQIVREDGTDIVYINFGAMLKDITRDDLTELYRIVMNRYGVNGPENELENVLWGYLKNIVHCLNLESIDIYIYMLIERKYPLSTEVCKAMLDNKLQGGKPDKDCYKLLKWMEKQAGIRNQPWENDLYGGQRSGHSRDNGLLYEGHFNHLIVSMILPRTGVNTPGSEEIE
ncbi:hypothetical protein Tco_0384869 [Tanacetum coccineum]